jgi:hypothetical protein
MSRLLNRLIIAILALAIVAPVLPARADQTVGKSSASGGTTVTKGSPKKHKKKKHKKEKHKKHHKAKAHHKRKHRRHRHHKRRHHRKSTTRPTK